MTKKNQHQKTKHLAVWVVLAAVFIFVALAGLVFGVYRFNSNNRFLTAAEKAIPFPALYIKGTGFVSIGEIKEDNRAIKKFYESQDFDKVGMRVDFGTEQGEKRLKVTEKGIINKLVENKVVVALAEKRGIRISDAMVDQQVNASIDQFGNRQNLMSDLARLYGWSLDDFKQKVVKPELYADKLAEVYASEIDVSKQEEKINSVLSRVATKKEDFAKVAAEVSEGESAKNGGDLGWSTESQLVPEISEKAFAMLVGEVSPVIKSSLGFHIIKLEEKKAEDGENMVHIRQIFVKTVTFGDWLLEQMKKYSVAVFLQDYQWNANTARVEFRDKAMQDFENNLDVNSQGDPSVFF
ncbi:MAG: peptidylprolyl isomerase [Candidatus Moranbacteria bacterium]|nr:peptidylprolyl isomerase [Candidatus Moranbacteria bacterium]